MEPPIVRTCNRNPPRGGLHAAGLSRATVPASACGVGPVLSGQRHPPGGWVGDGEVYVHGAPNGEAPGAGCRGNE